MNFFVLGLSHKTAPLELREKLSIPEDQISSFLDTLIQDEDIQEALLISTCNRVEVYIASSNPHRAIPTTKRLLSAKAEINITNLESHLYLKEDEAAIAHLFRVTSSLDSMVLGEPQIGGQVKDAYTQAVACRSVGAYLNKIIHKALNVSKKIRSETNIGQFPVSISYAAVLLAERIFGNLSQKRVLLVGIGEMGKLAAKYLHEKGVIDIWITNRTEEKAREVATHLGVGATVVPFSDLEKKLPEVDILITSTSADSYVIHDKMMRAVMRLRKNQPMFLIDISVPRNIDPVINQMENVYLYDVDNLNGIVDSNLKERERAARDAEEIVISEVKSFTRYLQQMDLSPTIQQLPKKFERIRQIETEKYLARLSNLSPKDQDMINACTRAIVNKILHEPIILMKTEEAQDGGPKYSEILKRLFRLESE